MNETYENLPKPQSRAEEYAKKIVEKLTGTTDPESEYDKLPPPQSRIEVYLKKIVEEMGGVNPEQVEEIIKTYLEEHPLETDATLSVSGKAADAKATGVAVDSLKKSIEALKEKRVEKTADDTSVVLDASKFYVFPEMQTLNVTGLNGHFRFTSGATATTLTLPDSVISDLAVEPNRIYEVSIVDGYLAWISWAVR